MLQTFLYRFLDKVSKAMGKTFENGFFRLVFVVYNTLTTKTMPGAVRLWAGTVNIDLFANRARYRFIFHGAGSFEEWAQS